MKSGVNRGHPFSLPLPRRRGRWRSKALVRGLLLLGLGAGSSEAQMVDRVAAVVNDEVITLSDLEWSIGYRRLPLPEDPAGRQGLLAQTLDQLIEQRLIAAEAAATPGISISLQEIDERIDAYRGQFADSAAFTEHLSRLGMTARDLHELVHRQLTVLKFVKLRFEPFVVILPDQIEAFYRDVFLPQLGVGVELAPPLSLVTEQIRQILQVETTTRDLDEWMLNARRRSRIIRLLFPDATRPEGFW